MNLFEKIKDCVESGYDVSFKRNALHLEIEVARLEKSKKQVLPISDHFTEDRVIGCIDFLIENKI